MHPCPPFGPMAGDNVAMTEITSGGELTAHYNSVFEANKNQWFDFEAIIQAVYEALLRADDVAIDGGAHMGLHSVPMARKVGPGGKVFAFEPIHEIVRAFRQRIETECPELKPIIELHELAISKHSGVAEFLVVEDPGYSGLRERLYPREMQKDRRKVLVDTLDHLCGGASPVRFIKLDLEGGEFDALRGAKGILSRERPAVVFEYDRFNTPRFYHYDHGAEVF